MLSDWLKINLNSIFSWSITKFPSSSRMLIKYPLNMYLHTRWCKISIPSSSRILIEYPSQPLPFSSRILIEYPSESSPSSSRILVEYPSQHLPSFSFYHYTLWFKSSLYYIYHGSYELTYLNELEGWVDLNKFMSKIHGIYGL